MQIWDKYLKNLDKEQSKIVVKYLNIAKRYAPSAVEELPYGVPGLKINGKGLIAIAAHKNHLGVYPFSPTVVHALKTKFNDVEFSEGTIRFKYNRLPSEEEIEMIVTLRLNEIM